MSLPSVLGICKDSSVCGLSEVAPYPQEKLKCGYVCMKALGPLQSPLSIGASQSPYGEAALQNP